MIMKKKSYTFRAIFLVLSYLLSACGAVGLQGAGNQEQSVVQVQSQDIAYTGVIEAINGSQWMINGVEVTVEPSVIQGGPFIVGDTVKVEGTVSSDGLVVVMQVQSPTAADLTGLPALGDSVDAVADDNNNSNVNTNGDDDDNQNTNLNTNNNTNGDDDDDDNTNLNANNNTNGDDDDDNTNTNANTNGDDDDDDDNNNNTNNNTNGDDDDDDDNFNGS